MSKSMLGFWSSSRKLAIFWLDESLIPTFIVGDLKTGPDSYREA